MKTPNPVPGRWASDRANDWYAQQPWLVGCNYVRASVINQIEMWQESTFDPATIEGLIRDYQRADRPILCTEYLARELGSTSPTYLPVLKAIHVAAINWGFVAGKTGTIRPWNSRDGRDPVRERARGEVLHDGDAFPEPPLRFHDLLRPDGTPFDPAEIDFIREIAR
jgi:hypothetical protein